MAGVTRAPVHACPSAALHVLSMFPACCSVRRKATFSCSPQQCVHTHTAHSRSHGDPHVCSAMRETAAARGRPAKPAKAARAWRDTHARQPQTQQAHQLAQRGAIEVQRNSRALEKARGAFSPEVLPRHQPRRAAAAAASFGLRLHNRAKRRDCGYTLR